jgi:uncharacterized protein YlxW (UPF0749 family)
MKRLFALTTIHVTTALGIAGNKLTGVAAVAPQVKEIPAGSFFKAMNEEQQAELIALKAARVADAEDAEAARRVEDIDLTEEAKQAEQNSQETAEEAEARILEETRAEYETVMEKKAQPNMKVETMRKAIDEKKAGDLV